MKSSFLFYIPAPLIAIGTFMLILLFNWLGYRFRKMQLRRYPDAEIDNLGSIEGSLLGLMGLLLAFSFGIAASKFENRRVIIVDEANNIGTAILRADLYPDSTRNLFRADFKEYVETRIDYYNAVNDTTLINTALEKANLCQMKLWRRATHEGQNIENRVRTAQMIPALNNLIDIVSTREAARQAKVPPIILYMLMLLVFTSGFLTGYNNKAKRRNIIMIIGFALMTTLALYLVMELDRPLRGIINLDGAEKNITDLRSLLKD